MNAPPTPQEAYETMRDYFSQPDAVLAYSDDQGQCMYRTPEGRKCAVGCLIPDELYVHTFDIPTCNDSSSVLHSIGWKDDVLVSFCAAAQQEHDSAQSVDDFLMRLDQCANEYELDVVAA